MKHSHRHAFIILTLMLVLALGASTAAGQNTITTVAGGGANSSVATSAIIIQPTSVAVDSQGNIFIVSRQLNQVFKVDATGSFSVVAGNGTNGFSGDGGPAIDATLGYPSGVAVDNSSNLFIADTNNSRIRELAAATGIITTVAGNGTAGYSGDGGAATGASLCFSWGVAVDGSGNLFIADTFNQRIRRVDAATGVITTVAGNGTQGYSGDGAPAASASVNNPYGVALDRAGNLFIADSYNNRIRRVDASTGIIITVAGNGAYAYGGDGGPATSASLGGPTGVTVDRSGNLYIADTFTNRIRRVDAPTGTIATLAGNGPSLPWVGSFSGDGGPATASNLNQPFSVVIDASGDLFIADSRNQRIRRVDAASGIITTIAGGGGDGDGGPATSALLASASGVAEDNSGNLYIADAEDSRVRRVNLATGIISSVAGNSTLGFSGDGGPATSASFSMAYGVAVDGGGDLFIADSFNSRVRRVDATTGIITTVAGSVIDGFSGDGGPATSARLYLPSAVALDGAGSLFIADEYNCRVRRVDAATGIITTVAGNGTQGYSGDGGPATSASMGFSTGVAVDAFGNLFIADTGNNRIRRVDGMTGIITSVAGNGTFGFSGDGGPATAGNLFFPASVAIDGAGNVFIADRLNYRIRRVDALTGIITTVAGNGTFGFSGDGGPATGASLNSPAGVAVDGLGHLLIADTNNNRIREVTLAPVVGLSSASLSFSNQTVGTASAAQTVTVTNTGGANLSVFIIAASGDFSQTNTCPVSPATLNPGSMCTISVTFTPTDSGAFDGTLTLTDSAFDSPQSVALSGDGEGFTAGAASGSSTTQSVAAGQTATYNLAFTPYGVSGTLALSCAGAPTGATCTINPASLALSGSGTANTTVTVTTTAKTMVPPQGKRDNPTFTPRALRFPIPLVGLLLLAILTSFAALSHTRKVGRNTAPILALAGVLFVVAVWAACGGGGLPTLPAAAVSLSASSLAFNSQNISSTSAPQAVTLTNSGNATLAITSVALTGSNSGDFTQTNTCSGAVSAGANCQISVKFSPTATGARAGSVTITDDAAGSPQSIALTGTGVPPATPPGPYTLTVTATLTSSSGTLTHTIPLTLTVN